MHDKVSSRQTESNVSLKPNCLESTDTDDSTTTELLSKEKPVKRKNSENPHGKGKRTKQDLGLAVDAMLLSTIKDISQNEKKILRHPLMKMLTPSSAGAVLTP